VRRLLLAACTAAALALPSAARDVPFLSGRVNDDAHLLDASDAQSLESILKTYDEKTGRQIVVLTVPSLEGDPLEDFSIKVARAWKLGRKGQNDGILILVAKDDHKARIEVGYGLEGTLPDALAGRIIRDEMVPRFRNNAYGPGIIAAANAVIRVLNGTYSPPPDPVSRRGDAADLGSGDKILASLFVFGILSVFEFVGVIAPGVGWFLYFFLIPFWTAFPMALWGVRFGLGTLAAHLIAFPILKMLLPQTEWGKRMSKNVRVGGGGSGGVWISGGGGSSGWSGGGGDSGGFSGGGGDFGGGGASGSW
jgi:uncharacterized protein